MHEASDLALYMDMNAAMIAFDQEKSVGTEQIMSSAPRPVERLYLHYKERLGYGEYQTDEKLNKIGSIVKDCRAAEVTFLPIGNLQRTTMLRLGNCPAFRRNSTKREQSHLSSINIQAASYSSKKKA